MDINIKVEVTFPPQFYESVHALAVAIAGSMELILDGPGARAAKPQNLPAPEQAQEEAKSEPVETADEGSTDLPAVTKEQVRARLSDLSRGGKKDELKKLFAQFGATKLSEVPEDKYSELYKAAEEIK